MVLSGVAGLGPPVSESFGDRSANRLPSVLFKIDFCQALDRRENAGDCYHEAKAIDKVRLMGISAIGDQ